MQIKDISQMGLTKILLVVNFFIPLTFFLILGVMHLAGFDGITWSGDIAIFGSLGYNVQYDPTGIFTVFLLFVISAFVKSWLEAAFIRFLAVFTKFGSIKIGYPPHN